MYFQLFSVSVLRIPSLKTWKYGFGVSIFMKRLLESLYQRMVAKHTYFGKLSPVSAPSYRGCPQGVNRHLSSHWKLGLSTTIF